MFHYRFQITKHWQKTVVNEAPHKTALQSIYDSQNETSAELILNKMLIHNDMCNLLH